ncbi:ABC transporter ATP-binding protein [Streptomyces sp. NPDC059349]|uniref:ABC transporter ATP-binding protein n=1 Tax=Streptomyces sp. NPDC059349 TaxID=3346808 RepID=UPI00368408B7
MRLAPLRATFTLSWQHARRSVRVMLVLVPLTAAAPGLSALGLQWMVDGLLDGSDAKVIAGALSAAVAGAFALAGHRMLQLHKAVVGQVVGREIERDVRRWCATLPTISHVEDPASVSRIEQISGLGVRAVILATNAVFLMRTGLWLVMTTVLLALIHPALILLPLCMAPGLWLDGRANSLDSAARSDSAEPSRSERHLVEKVLDPATGKELRLGTSGPYVCALAQQRWRQVTRRLLRALLTGGALHLAGSAVFVAGLLGAVLFTAHLMLSGATGVGTVLLVAALGGQVRAQLDASGAAFRGSAKGLDMIDAYLWLRDLAAAAGRDADGPVPKALAQGITLRAVDFGYHEAKPVLHGIDLHLRAGATVALVGDHGSGKTTLVKLLCGLYRPTAGTISVDGTSLSSMDMDAWRTRMTATFQDFSRFPFRAAQTVGVGDLPRMDDQAAVDCAAVRGGADEVFAKLPEGGATRLGTATDDGVELSGGQWQKLALARAFMRDRPLLAVLDEPTAALDSASEYEVYRQYAMAAMEWREAVGGVTLLVSHRFSTIRMADLIVVLDNGRIAERGTHAELLEVRGRYAHLYNLQAAAYK